MNRTVPLYAYNGELIEHATEKRVARLEKLGLVRVVRHRKGHVNRAVFHRRPGEASPGKLTDYVGTQYSFPQRLGDGHVCWRLRSLGGSRSETDLAPDAVRPIFLRVLMECMAKA